MPAIPISRICPLHRFPIDAQPMVALQHDGNAARSVSGTISIDGVDRVFDSNLLGRRWLRVIVQAASAETEQLRLQGEGQIRVLVIHEGLPFRVCQGQGQFFEPGYLGGEAANLGIQLLHLLFVSGLEHVQ